MWGGGGPATAAEFQIPVVALRLFLPQEDDEYLRGSGPDAGITTAGSDVVRAYLAALSVDLPPGLHTPHISGNRGNTICLAHARDVLGWEPLLR